MEDRRTKRDIRIGIACLGLVVVAVVGIWIVSHVDRSSKDDSTPSPVANTVRTNPQSGSGAIVDMGVITGRLYADGGPCCHDFPDAVRGQIAVRRAGSHVIVARPHQDAEGYFGVRVEPGRYDVVGTSLGGYASVRPFFVRLVVRSGTPAYADFGIHRS